MHGSIGGTRINGHPPRFPKRAIAKRCSIPTDHDHERRRIPAAAAAAAAAKWPPWLHGIPTDLWGMATPRAGSISRLARSRYLQSLSRAVCRRS